MGWELTSTEDIITPVIAEKEIKTDSMVVPAGFAAYFLIALKKSFNIRTGYSVRIQL